MTCAENSKENEKKVIELCDELYQFIYEMLAHKTRFGGGPQCFELTHIEERIQEACHILTMNINQLVFCLLKIEHNVSSRLIKVTENSLYDKIKTKNYEKCIYSLIELDISIRLANNLGIVSDKQEEFVTWQALKINSILNNIMFKGMNNQEKINE